MNVFKHVYTSALGIDRKCEIKIITMNENHEGVPVVIAPGFLTEGQDDWLNYIAERIDAPLIFVKWRSSSILKMSMSALSSLLATSSVPAIGVLRLASFGASFFSAWSSAAKEATLAGQDLTKVLNDIWDNDDKAIFIGHSLGVRVITEAMRTLRFDNVLTSISIAGAINKEHYQERICAIKSAREITHINMFSDNDSVLKWLYRIGEFNVKKVPIGLVQSDLPNITNIKTSIGHTEYHKDETFGELIVQLHKEALQRVEA